MGRQKLGTNAANVMLCSVSELSIIRDVLVGKGRMMSLQGFGQIDDDFVQRFHFRRKRVKLGVFVVAVGIPVKSPQSLFKGNKTKYRLTQKCLRETKPNTG